MVNIECEKKMKNKNETEKTWKNESIAAFHQTEEN